MKRKLAPEALYSSHWYDLNYGERGLTKAEDITESIKSMNKTIRLPDGRFITRKVRESDPRALAAAKPEEIWTMNDGKSHSGKTQYTRDILIRDMETSHIANALRILVQQAYSKMVMIGIVPKGNAVEFGAGDTYTPSDVLDFAQQTMPKFVALQKELNVRLGRRAPEPEPVLRKFDFD